MSPATGQLRPRVRHWHAPDKSRLGKSLREFLVNMGGPTIIHLQGADPQRCRFVTTLVHGNEPSGTKALFRLLREEIVPAVDTCCFFASVSTALTEPHFYHRQLPDNRDFNRCFVPPFDDREGEIAKAFMAFAESRPFEALIDVHNTSGMGPPFAIARVNDRAHQALASFFTERLMVTGLRLGSLFEFADGFAPAITVECGGTSDPYADEIAYEGIRRYLLSDDPLSAGSPDLPMQIIHEPARLEIAADTEIHYGFERHPSADITLLADIEHLNLAEVDTNTHLGWLRPESWQKLRLKTPDGSDIKDRLLRLEGNRLMPAIPLTLLMVTTNPVIAKSDCLFYAAPANQTATDD